MMSTDRRKFIHRQKRKTDIKKRKTDIQKKRTDIKKRKANTKKRTVDKKRIDNEKTNELRNRQSKIRKIGLLLRDRQTDRQTDN